MPLKSEGMTRFKAFLYGTLSGIVEPLSAIVTILLTSALISTLPFLLYLSRYCALRESTPKRRQGCEPRTATHCCLPPPWRVPRNARF